MTTFVTSPVGGFFCELLTIHLKMDKQSKSPILHSLLNFALLYVVYNNLSLLAIKIWSTTSHWAHLPKVEF